MTRSDVSVSVIVPAYNAADTLPETLAALQAQTYRGPLEIIVVDDGSTDGTKAAVAAFPQVKYLFQTNAGPASARNHGARHATGEILMFTDSDCRPEPQWAEKMLQGFADGTAGAVAGSYGIADERPVLARIIHREIRFRHTRLMPEFVRAFGSYNVAIRRAAFEQVGGFDAQYRRASGEDNDLSYKVLNLGLKIRFLKDAVVDHYHQADLWRYLKEQFRHGVWRVRMYADHPQMARGDDYTFWKDMLEVPVSCLSVLGLCFFPGQMAGGIFLGFWLFEAACGVWMMASLGHGLLAGCVFFLRSYARTAGFIWGGLNFIFSLFICRKKSKIPLRH